MGYPPSTNQEQVSGNSQAAKKKGIKACVFRETMGVTRIQTKTVCIKGKYRFAYSESVSEPSIPTRFEHWIYLGVRSIRSWTPFRLHISLPDSDSGSASELDRFLSSINRGPPTTVYPISTSRSSTDVTQIHSVSRSTPLSLLFYLNRCRAEIPASPAIILLVIVCPFPLPFLSFPFLFRRC